MTPIVALRTLLKIPSSARALAGATREHRKMELHFRKELAESAEIAGRLSFPNLEFGWSRYFERNFFSILFVSIYKVIGIPLERRRHYALITHALRGIVTATDNLLDEEDKGAVRLRLDGGRTLSNVMGMLLQSNALHEAIEMVASDEKRRHLVRQRLMEALFRIALEESGEEEGVDDALSPEQVLKQIHSLRGGALLELAFLAPEANEPEMAAPVRAARRGVRQIGLGLQMLDDVTDLAEDVARRNHNVLRSWIVHRGEDGPITDAVLRAYSEEELKAPETQFPASTRSVIALALETALDGFDLLHRLGHPIDRASAMEMAHAMFRLRGLAHLWELYGT